MCKAILYTKNCLWGQYS